MQLALNSRLNPGPDLIRRGTVVGGARVIIVNNQVMFSTDGTISNAYVLLMPVLGENAAQWIDQAMERNA